jgi:hypothetical protein
MRARTLRVSTIGDRSVQASLRRPLPLIVSEPAVTGDVSRGSQIRGTPSSGGARGVRRCPLCRSLLAPLSAPVNRLGASRHRTSKAMKARGMPDWLVTHQLTAAHIAAEGALSTENTVPIRDIVNRAPITTKQFVEDHKGAFS